MRYAVSYGRRVLHIVDETQKRGGNFTALCGYKPASGWQPRHCAVGSLKKCLECEKMLKERDKI